MSFTQQFLAEVQQVTAQLNADAIEKCADELARVRERGGRLFILGVGGSAGNAGHAVNDFRKICGFEAYAPTDNVSELTARTNDEGWATIFSEWLKGSRTQCEGRPAHFFRRRRQSGKERQPESRQRDSTRQTGRRVGHRHCRTRWRLHGEGSDRVRHRADGESDPRHAAQRSVSGGHLASVRVASQAQSRPDQMGDRTK